MNIGKRSNYLALSTILWMGASFLHGAGPGKIEAESPSVMSGVKTEPCSEGGLDMGWIDQGDWMVYPIKIATAGKYTISYRVASPNTGKYLSSDLNAGATQLGTVTIKNTGGWQAWTTVTQTVSLPAGSHNFGINAGSGGFNLNWFSIDAVDSGDKIEGENYASMSGVKTEPCVEGGLNVGWLDKGDWMIYPITVPAAGSYTFQYRVASPNANVSFSTDLNGGATQLGSVNVKNTGGWQAWTTVTQTVNLPVGSHNFGINAGTGGWNLNWFSYSYDGPVVTPTDLIPLASGKQMTFQFVNNTGGKFADSQIYVLMIARNDSGKFSYLDKNGNMNLCVPGQNASSYSIRISDFAGYQFPTFLDSGRLYVSYGAPLNIPINSDINGNVGIAFPNIENPSDPNINTYFDWVEFAVIRNEIWCNTTQVDQFGFPMVMELFQGTANSYKSFAKVGITESRSAIYDSWNSSVPAEFKSLANQYRILAPLHGGFRSGGAHSTYFDAYINQMWSQYYGSDLVITIPQGTFAGRVQSDNRLRFTKSGSSTPYYVAKPNGDAVWGGLGALALPSPENWNDRDARDIELALEAQICAAFHRHVMGNASTWNTPSAYFQAAPCDYFTKFWHEHSINARAYGFCYDDVNDQSSTMTCASPRGIILSVGF